jgi:hypothetical protein
VDGRWLSAGLGSGEHGDGGAEALSNGGRKPPGLRRSEMDDGGMYFLALMFCIGFMVFALTQKSGG